MKFNKVIYFRYIPLTQKAFHDFYMEELAHNGIEVEYWDLSDVFFKKNYAQEDASYLTKTIKFQSYPEIETAIRRQNLEKTLFISIVTYEGRVIRLYKLFTQYNCKLAVFGRNMMPIFEKKSLFQQLINKIPKDYINYINNRKSKKLKIIGRVKNYDILFLGGNEGWKTLGITHPMEIKSAQKVMINSNDYDNTMTLKNAPCLFNNAEYVLFLDEYLPLHPDFRLLGMKSITPEQYYPQLNHYFDKVEKQFGFPVIIAAHPKALKYKEMDYFNNRKVYFGQTAILSRDAKFVLAHDSTSVNFPVAFNIPIHFMTSRSIEKEMYSVHCNVINFAKYLNCNWQYFDSENEPINLTEGFSSEAYLNYKYDFQCSKETENKQTKDIFMEFLKS